MEPGTQKISTIKLDEATRARVAKELGVPTGIDWVPEEITFMAVDQREAGAPLSDVEGYGFGSSLYLNPAVTPNLTAARAASFGVFQRRRLVIARLV